MAYRPLLKADQWSAFVGVPTDEESLIRHYSLSGDDIMLALSKRGHRNKFGFALQLCLLRHPGRPLWRDPRDVPAYPVRVRRAAGSG